jgi:hypothetical protein
LQQEVSEALNRHFSLLGNINFRFNIEENFDCFPPALFLSLSPKKKKNSQLNSTNLAENQNYELSRSLFSQKIRKLIILLLAPKQIAKLNKSYKNTSLFG